jgi:GST-like protein
MNHRMLGCKGCGNAIVECAFALAGVPLAYEEVDYGEGSPTRAQLLALNALGQVPTLVLPDGRVMTESLAMIHHVDDLAPGAGLIPPRGDAAREEFYRWAVMLVSAVYPTFTYGDEPRKWVADEEAAKTLRTSTDRHRETLWRRYEAAARAPRFLGEPFSALDLYIGVMTRWRPGPRWFEANTPKLWAIAQKTSATARVADVMKRHFG